MDKFPKKRRVGVIVPSRHKGPLTRPRDQADGRPTARAAAPAGSRNPGASGSPSEARAVKSMVEFVTEARGLFEQLLKTEGRVPALHARAINLGRRLKQRLRNSETQKAEFEAALAKENIRVSKRQAYGAIFRLLYGPYRQEKSKLSRYSRLAAFADARKFDQNQLLYFLLNNGGLNKSAIVAGRLLNGEDDTTARRGRKSNSAAKAAVHVDADFDPHEFDKTSKGLTHLHILRQKRPGIYSCVYDQLRDGRMVCLSIRREQDYSILNGYSPFKK